ncbi:MAG: hypothetical protein ACREX8_17475 [Gammaproteobacteria bacterium]
MNRDRYTALIRTADTVQAVGRFWCQINAVRFGTAQQNAGRGTFLGTASVLITNMFLVEHHAIGQPFCWKHSEPCEHNPEHPTNNSVSKPTSRQA